MSTDPLGNPELLGVMRAAAEGRAPGGAAAVGAMLLDATLLVPGVRNPADGEVWPAGIKRADDRWDFVCFTDRRAAAAWGPDVELWTGVIGSELVDFVLESGGVRLVINPAGPYGGALDRAELERLAARPRRRDFSALRPLSREPDDRLRQRIQAAVEETDDLAAVYALETSDEHQPPHPVFGLVLSDDADAAPVVAALGRTLAGIPLPGSPVDFVPLTRDEVARIAAIATPIAGVPPGMPSDPNSRSAGDGDAS